MAEETKVPLQKDPVPLIPPGRKIEFKELPEFVYPDPYHAIFDPLSSLPSLGRPSASVSGAPGLYQMSDFREAPRLDNPMSKPELPQNMIIPSADISGKPMQTQKMEMPKLENIVSTVDLDCKLDLRKIALQAKNAEYNPKRFAAVIMRIRNPKTTALIFGSGKMVCTGAKDEDSSMTAARKYAKTIKKLEFNVKFKGFMIQNIVGSCGVNFAINLEALLGTHGKFCTYDPEIFPGLIYRMEQPKIVLLIFCSGKVVLTGAKKREQLDEAFKKIYPTLKMCEKKIVAPTPRT